MSKSKIKHTPGPWHWTDDALTRRMFNIYAPAATPHEHVATVNNLSIDSLWARDPETALANARLIAAAPDLLEALRGLVAAVEAAAAAGIDLSGHVGVGKALAAIAKAEGRS